MDLSNIEAVTVTYFELFWSRPHLDSHSDISRCPLRNRMVVTVTYHVAYQVVTVTYLIVPLSTT